MPGDAGWAPAQGGRRHRRPIRHVDPGRLPRPRSACNRIIDTFTPFGCAIYFAAASYDADRLETALVVGHVSADFFVYLLQPNSPMGLPICKIVTRKL